MDYLTGFAQRFLALWNGLNELQQLLVGALGAILAYLLLRALLRSIVGLAMVALLFVIAFVALRLAMPETLCSVKWPAAIAFVCDR